MAFPEQSEADCGKVEQPHGHAPRSGEITNKCEDRKTDGQPGEKGGIWISLEKAWSSSLNYSDPFIYY